MQTAPKPSTHPAWSKAFSQPAPEFPLTSLPRSGKIPEGLRGTLYRNGPGRLERGGERVGHWFDGDGAILAIQFGEGVTAAYRYVQTQGYQEEAAANRFLFPNYGMTAPGPVWNNWLKDVKNAANTSVLAVPDKLLALWEGGNPHALDRQTLQTRGTELSGLEPGDPFSAHPKVDPKTGEIFNFGVVPGINATLKIYALDRTGKIIKTGSIALEGLPLVHDFVMAGQYLVFFVPPVRVKLLPVALGMSSYSEAMAWKPELGTQILVVDRNTLSLVSRGEAPPWYQWHFANGYIDTEGNIVTQIARFQDFQTNQNLKEVATGKMETPARASLWQVRLHPQTGKVIENEEVLARSCEFPVVPPHQVGQPWRYTYIAIHRQEQDVGKELLNAIARYDRQTGELSVADMGENCYPTEPIFVPETPHSDRGWVLTVVYDGNTDTSEVQVYRSDLASEPICRLELPSVVPPGFHGTWAEAAR